MNHSELLRALATGCILQARQGEHWITLSLEGALHHLASLAFLHEKAKIDSLRVKPEDFVVYWIPGNTMSSMSRKAFKKQDGVRQQVKLTYYGDTKLLKSLEIV